MGGTFRWRRQSFPCCEQLPYLVLCTGMVLHVLTSIARGQATPRLNRLSLRVVCTVARGHIFSGEMKAECQTERFRVASMPSQPRRFLLPGCELYVPGTQAKIIPKAAKSAADVVAARFKSQEHAAHFFESCVLWFKPCDLWRSWRQDRVRSSKVMDLEDSVAVGEKEIARKNVIQALKDISACCVLPL